MITYRRSISQHNETHLWYNHDNKQIVEHHLAKAQTAILFSNN